ncbi:BglG family transcription antiterminator [Virgibacillus proomii]|uniref:BglG family transcription antiterminator n=1 Tax=Virgibacillus proomii TaxID=84407 RepID=UPI002815A74E|nr:PRD domain-containing protein [Virgibacillus proomii]
MLRRFLSNNTSFSISDLAEQYGVSERTIRYDLEEIDDFLNENEFSPLERVIKMEILLRNNKAEKNKLFKLLSKDNEKNYIYTSEERIDIMTLILGLSKDYVTLNKFSQVLDVSIGTIKNDLKKLKRELSFLNLSIESMPHYGIKIVGNELNIRKRIVYLLFHRFKLLSTSKVLKENAVPLGDNIYEEILANLGNINLNYLKKLVGVVETELDRKISYDSFSLLFYYLLSTVIRLKNGFILNKGSSKYKSLLGSIEYRAAATIRRLIKYKDDSFIISEEETGIIAELISGSQIMHTDNFYLEKDVKLRIIVKHLISNVSKKINMDLTRDSHLFYSLLEHLRPALQRFDNQAFISNNIVQEIRTDYKELFRIVSESLAPLELGTEEIAYLTIHFLSSIERLLPKKQKKPKVLLVCNSGIGTVNLIEARVKKNFEVYIVDAIPLHDLERTLQMDKVDLIISTIRIFVMDIPCIFVNPFITEEDLDNIQQNLLSIKQRNRSVNNRLKDYFSNCPIQNQVEKKGKKLR